MLLYVWFSPCECVHSGECDDAHFRREVYLVALAQAPYVLHVCLTLHVLPVCHL